MSGNNPLDEAKREQLKRKLIGKITRQKLSNVTRTRIGEEPEKKVREVEQRLLSLGFLKTVGGWKKGMLLVPVYHQHIQGKKKPFKAWFQILWRLIEPIVIYDYSEVKGPVCIVPTAALFKLKDVYAKTEEVTNDKIQSRWSQEFSSDDELGKLILNFRDRWDLL